MAEAFPNAFTGLSQGLLQGFQMMALGQEMKSKQIDQLLVSMEAKHKILDSGYLSDDLQTQMVHGLTDDINKLSGLTGGKYTNLQFDGSHDNITTTYLRKQKKLLEGLRNGDINAQDFTKLNDSLIEEATQKAPTVGQKLTALGEKEAPEARKTGAANIIGLLRTAGQPGAPGYNLNVTPSEVATSGATPEDIKQYNLDNPITGDVETTLKNRAFALSPETYERYTKEPGQGTDVTTDMKNFEATHPGMKAKRGTPEYAAAFNKERITLPGAKQYESSYERLSGEARFYRENLPATIEMASRGEVGLPTSAWRPQFSLALNQEVAKWNKAHPDKYVNPKLLEAVQSSNKKMLENVGTLWARNKVAATAVEKHVQIMDGLVDQLGYTDLTPLNKAILTGKRVTGSTAAAQYVNAGIEVMNEYSKVLQGTGMSGQAATDAARKEVSEMIPLNATPAQMHGIITQMRKMITQKMESYQEMIDNATSAIGQGVVAGSTGAPGSISTPTSGTAGANPFDQ